MYTPWHTQVHILVSIYIPIYDVWCGVCACICVYVLAADFLMQCKGWGEFMTATRLYQAPQEWPLWVLHTITHERSFQMTFTATSKLKRSETTCSCYGDNDDDDQCTRTIEHKLNARPPHWSVIARYLLIIYISEYSALGFSDEIMNNTCQK